MGLGKILLLHIILLFIISIVIPLSSARREVFVDESVDVSQCTDKADGVTLRAYKLSSSSTSLGP